MEKNFKCHYASWKCHPSKHQCLQNKPVWKEMNDRASALQQISLLRWLFAVQASEPPPSWSWNVPPSGENARAAWLTWFRVRHVRLIIRWQVFVDPGNQRACVEGFWCHSKKKRRCGFISNAMISCGGPGWCHENTKWGCCINAAAECDHRFKWLKMHRTCCKTLNKPICSCLGWNEWWVKLTVSSGESPTLSTSVVAQWWVSTTLQRLKSKRPYLTHCAHSLISPQLWINGEKNNK